MGLFIADTIVTYKVVTITIANVFLSSVADLISSVVWMSNMMDKVVDLGPTDGGNESS